MDKLLVERAVQALAALNSLRQPDSHSVVQRENPTSASELPVAKTQEERAPCGISYCAGCCDVGDGKRIHPPRCGEDYGKWLKRWKPEGKAQ